MISDAYRLAAGRGVLPTALGTRALREAFTRAVRARAVFSARTTSAVYLDIQRQVIERLLAGEIGKAEARTELKLTLDAIGYDAERGHFGLPEDAEIPPAEYGSLRDLRSDRRLNLIIDTQRTLYAHAGMKERGLEPASVYQYPCWELVRTGARAEPRKDWPERFEGSGGALTDDERMIAGKRARVWERLGDADTFRDALDTDTPPFAFGSGMGWRGVPRAEAIELGKFIPAAAKPVQGPHKTPAGNLPTPQADTGGMSQATVDKLKAILKAKKAAAAGKLQYSTALEGAGG